MSKYDPLWRTVAADERPRIKMSFDEIEKILGFPIDHSFLTFKKELNSFGRKVGKISMKEKTVCFEKTETGE